MFSVRAVPKNNVLKFPRAELQDDGMYQCVASNKVGMAVTSTEVKVKGKRSIYPLTDIVFLAFFIQGRNGGDLNNINSLFSIQVMRIDELSSQRVSF
mgnify:CR=1 FL=1